MNFDEQFDNLEQLYERLEEIRKDKLHLLEFVEISEETRRAPIWRMVDNEDDIEEYYENEEEVFDYWRLTVNYYQKEKK